MKSRRESYSNRDALSNVRTIVKQNGLSAKNKNYFVGNLPLAIGGGSIDGNVAAGKSR